MKIALLTNFIPPYRKALLTQFSNLVGNLHILVSVHMENNRNWSTDYARLNVTKQKVFSYTKKWKHQIGFEEQTEIHLPLDTIFKLRNINPDVVISGELGFRSFFSLIYCKMYSKPLILWLTLSDHTELNKTGIRVLVRKMLLRNARVLMCNGAACDRYIKNLGIIKPTFFIPYTSDFLLSKPKTKFNKNRKILYTGQLNSRKGITQMIRALKNWSIKHTETTIEFIVAGDGPEKNKFSEIANCENIVLKMMGSINYNELKKLYEEADLYLFPTLADEWGVVVNEALSSGLPIIGSLYSQAVEEIIINFKNGWVFKPDENESLETAITMAINTNDFKLAEMSKNCIASIASYSPTAVAKTMAEACVFASQEK